MGYILLEAIPIPQMEALPLKSIDIFKCSFPSQFFGSQLLAMATFLLPAVTSAPCTVPSSTGAGAALHAPAVAPRALGLCLTLAVAGHLSRGRVLRGRRGSRGRVGRRAQRPINARDGKTIPQGGSWLLPAVDDDELYEEMENELPPKKSLEDSVYCCWVP